MTPKLPNVPSVPSAPSAPSVPSVPSVPNAASGLPTDLPGGDESACPPLEDPHRFSMPWVFHEYTDQKPPKDKAEVFPAGHDTHLQPLDEQLPAIDSFTTETDGELEPCGVVHVARTHAGDTTFNLVVVSPRYSFSR